MTCTLTLTLIHIIYLLILFKLLNYSSYYNMDNGIVVWDFRKAYQFHALKNQKQKLFENRIFKHRLP